MTAGTLTSTAITSKHLGRDRSGSALFVLFSIAVQVHFVNALHVGAGLYFCPLWEILSLFMGVFRREGGIFCPLGGILARQNAGIWESRSVLIRA